MFFSTKPYQQYRLPAFAATKSAKKEVRFFLSFPERHFQVGYLATILWRQQCYCQLSLKVTPNLVDAAACPPFPSRVPMSVLPSNQSCDRNSTLGISCQQRDNSGAVTGRASDPVLWQVLRWQARSTDPGYIVSIYVVNKRYQETWRWYVCRVAPRIAHAPVACSLAATPVFR